MLPLRESLQQNLKPGIKKLSKNRFCFQSFFKLLVTFIPGLNVLHGSFPHSTLKELLGGTVGNDQITR